MRITVDLDEDLLSAVEERRTASKTTGEVLADLARQALRTATDTEFAALPSVRGSNIMRESEGQAAKSRLKAAP